MNRMSTYVIIAIVIFAAIFFATGGHKATGNLQSQWG